jgi:integrase
MFAFVALTGARRSEMLRSRIEDIDFDAGVVRIREKKRDKSKKITFRNVEMASLLRQVMKDWLDKHPGGPYTITQTLTTPRGKTRPEFVPLTIDEANHHFKRTLEGTKWEVIKGFHVFRHSFASNLAHAGVDQRVIDEFMGHQTEEMRKRYRHLLPDQRRKAIESFFAA